MAKTKTPPTTIIKKYKIIQNESKIFDLVKTKGLEKKGEVGKV
jgi:hypothetical protein